MVLCSLICQVGFYNIHYFIHTISLCVFTMKCSGKRHTQAHRLWWRAGTVLGDYARQHGTNFPAHCQHLAPTHVALPSPPAARAALAVPSPLAGPARCCTPSLRGPLSSVDPLGPLQDPLSSMPCPGLWSGRDGKVPEQEHVVCNFQASNRVPVSPLTAGGDRICAISHAAVVPRGIHLRTQVPEVTYVTPLNSQMTQ